MTQTAGLALGAVIFGRRADRWERPLVAYAWVEILIGLYALVLPLFIGLAGTAYEAAAARWFEQGTLKLVLRFVLSAEGQAVTRASGAFAIPAALARSQRAALSRWH